MNGLTQYLAEMKAELQELYESLDHEIRSTGNQDLIDDSYFSVTSKLETTLSELDTLINDVDNGVYTDPIEGHGALEVEDEDY